MAALIQKLAGAGGTGPPKAAAGAGLLCPICGLARCSLGGRPSLGRHAASLALLGPSINDVCEDSLDFGIHQQHLAQIYLQENPRNLPPSVRTSSMDGPLSLSLCLTVLSAAAADLVQTLQPERALGFARAFLQ